MKLLLIILLAQVIDGQVSVIGNCPDVPVAKNFQLNKNLGHWYVISRYGNMFDDNVRCLEGNFTLIKEGHIEGYFTGIKKIDNSVHNGFTECTYTGDIFNMAIHKKTGILRIPMKAIASNNVDYTAYWGCLQFFTYSEYYTWIFSRERTLSPDFYNRILDVYKQYNLCDQHLLSMNQTNCPDI